MFFPQRLSSEHQQRGGNEERSSRGVMRKYYLRNVSQCLKHIRRRCFKATKKCCFVPADMVSILQRVYALQSGRQTPSKVRCWMLKTFWIKGCSLRIPVLGNSPRSFILRRSHRKPRGCGARFCGSLPPYTISKRQRDIFVF